MPVNAAMERLHNSAYRVGSELLRFGMKVGAVMCGELLSEAKSGAG